MNLKDDGHQHNSRATIVINGIVHLACGACDAPWPQQRGDGRLSGCDYCGTDFKGHDADCKPCDCSTHDYIGKGT